MSTDYCCCCSVDQLCPTLCDPMDCSILVFPILHYLPEFAQTHVYWVSDSIQSSHPLSSPFILPSIFPSIRVFSNELALRIKCPKTGAAASVLPMNIQDLFPLGLTGLIVLLSKELSRVFSSTTVWDIHKCAQLIFDKGAKAIQWKKDRFFNR